VRYFLLNLVHKFFGMPFLSISSVAEEGLEPEIRVRELGDASVPFHFDIHAMMFLDNAPITSSYELGQNYPNPFNPTTHIRFNIPETDLVNITIYNMLGRQVKTLVNQTHDPGYKSIIWAATNNYGKPVSAGIYLYQIQAGEYISTKKMVLLK